MSATTETTDQTCERVDMPVTGMSCAGCASSIEKRLNKVPGVRNASVNFATARARVEYDPAATSVHHLVDAVRDAGYDTPDVEPDAPAAPSEHAHHEDDLGDLRRRFWIAAALYPLTGWLLSPVIASAAMSLSSVSVVANSLRLRRFR